MARLRRYFVPALLLAPVVFVCGKLLLTSVQPERLALQFNQAAVVNDVSERGWPWVFHCSPVPNRFSRAKQPGDFFLWLFIADLGVLAGIIAIASWLIYWHRSRHSRWLQLSLKESFVVIALFSIGFAWWNYERRQYEREQAVFENNGGRDRSGTNSVYCGPEWLRRLAPGIDQSESIFKRVVAIEQVIFRGAPVRILSELRDFPHTRMLVLSQKNSIIIWDESDFTGKKREPPPPEDLSELDQVETVALQFFGDEELLKSVCTLPRLRTLVCYGVPVTDVGFSLITKCSSLEVLALSECRVHDQEFALLANLTQLRGLKLDELKITNASLDTLLKLTDLEELDLKSDFTDDIEIFSDATVLRLAAMPKLRDLELTPTSDEASLFLSEFRTRRRNEKISGNAR